LKILVTGGAGFIGSRSDPPWSRADTPSRSSIALTYAGNLSSLADLQGKPGFIVRPGRHLRRAEAMAAPSAAARPEAVMHLAAESHVDRSIDGPGEFIATNVTGTFQAPQAALGYWRSLEGAPKDQFRFLHVSTDEVFGSPRPPIPPSTRRRLHDPAFPVHASKRCQRPPRPRPA
jgi:dTDP-glucose 4,6-dehydratase